MRKLDYLLTIYVLCLGISCNTNGQVKPNAVIPPSQLTFTTSVNPLIELERTQCLGTCPVYKVKLMHDGTVLYKGTEYVKSLGVIRDRIVSSVIDQLMVAFATYGFSSLRNSYRTEKDGCITMSDAPTVYVSVYRNNRKKTVAHYLGCSGRTRKIVLELERLAKLETRIEELVNTERWIGTPNERKSFQYVSRP